MSSERPSNPSSNQRKGGFASEDGNPAQRALRTILLLSFGGLLVLLLYAGASALQTLRRLHDIEQSARARSLERQRVLATVILSANLYSTQIEEFLLSVEPADSADVEMSKQADAARAALQTYPQDREPEEESLLDQLEAFFTDQDRLFRSAKEWNREQLRRRAQQVVSENIIPRRQQFVATVRRIELLNQNEASAIQQASFLEFGRLQDRLTRSLIVVLGCGLVLAIGSVIYILRLERQGQLRYRELAHNRRELQQLSNRLVDAQEAERRSISRELHDEVGQALGLLLMDLGQLSSQLREDEKSREVVQRAKSVAERAVQTVRNMALLLRPSMLDDLGLVSAVEWYAREMSRRGEIEVEVRSSEVSEQLPDEIKICVYRVIQEALNNAQRHSHATTAAVQLAQTNSSVHVKITDNGSGFDPKHTRGMGLLGMEERVRRLGGQLAIDSQPGVGTTITVELPATTKVQVER